MTTCYDASLAFIHVSKGQLDEHQDTHRDRFGNKLSHYQISVLNKRNSQLIVWQRWLLLTVFAVSHFKNLVEMTEYSRFSMEQVNSMILKFLQISKVGTLCVVVC